MFKNRWYQQEAIDSALKKKNGIIVLPTGAGKSLVIAGIVKETEGQTLVLQPSKEILESNASKVKAFGMSDVGVYSASAGKKTTGKVTYATIGSIIKKLDLFSQCKTIIIDECHLVNAKGGMYDKLIKTISPERLIGLTATPYRQARNSYGTATRILTRTRPKIFKDILYWVNPKQLVDEGFLTSPEIVTPIDIDNRMLRENTTGGDFTPASIKQFIEKNKLNDPANSERFETNPLITCVSAMFLLP